MLSALPNVLQEKIALYSLELPFPRGQSYEGLFLLNREWRKKFESFYEFWTLCSKEIAKHAYYNEHLSFLAQFRSFYRAKILTHFHPDQRGQKLREIYLPHCDICQGPILRFLNLHLGHFVHVRNLQYFNIQLLDAVYGNTRRDLMALIENAPQMHVYINGYRLDLEVEDKCIDLFTRFGNRIHFGSLLLNAQKNQGTNVVPYEIKDSFLWTLLSMEQEKIREFEPHVMRSLKNQFGDYSLALYQLAQMKQLKFFEPVPLSFYFQIFLFFLRDHQLWSRTELERSLLPIQEIMNDVQRHSMYRTHLLWTLFKGFSQTVFAESQIEYSLEPVMQIFQQLIQKYIDPGVSFYQFFESHFQSLKICDHCTAWLNQQSPHSFPKLCLMCVFRRHLTFTNSRKMIEFLQKYSFPNDLINLVLNRLVDSSVFMARLSLILWQAFQYNQSENLTELIRICETFQIEPLKVLSWQEEGQIYDGFIPRMDILATSSSGVVALFLDQCQLTSEELGQCMTDLADYQLKKLKREQDDKKKQFRGTLQRTSRWSPKEDLQIPQSYPFFPHSLIFPRESIDVPLI